MRVSKSHIVSVAALAAALAAPGRAEAQAALPQDQGRPEGMAEAQDVPAQPPRRTIASNEEIIVTAQKRAAAINDVPMSITAATGDELVKLGVQDQAELTKLVPGFTFNETAYGVPVFTIRGIGFQETSLGASPAVSVYIDEVPIPFSAEAKGAGIDIQRLEVLKGPQGTLFGSNSTGGALNYIAAKPGDVFEAGFDLSFGSFSTLDLNAYVSTPIGETGGIRVAARITQADDFQRSMTRDDMIGQKDFLQGRMILDFEPAEWLYSSLNFMVMRDQSDSPAPQFVAFAALNAGPTVPPGFINFPQAPEENDVADWDPDKSYARDNEFYFLSLRNEIDLGSNIGLTSLTSLQRFDRYQPVEGDGTPFENYFGISRGGIKTFFQELRFDGTIGDSLTWIVGANYEFDDIDDITRQLYSESSSATVFGIPLGPTEPTTYQEIETFGIFGNVDYDFSRFLTLHAGIRYTDSTRDLLYGCGRDLDGSWAEVSEAIQRYLNTLDGKGPVFTEVPTGGCGTTDQFTNEPRPAVDTLSEDNVSWRVGLDWKPNSDILIYGNVSRGYKAGSFPTLAASSTRQFEPVVQETVLAYELGTKATLAGGLAQVNAAAFYYDYSNKQILGRIPDLAFGPLPALVNVPESRVWGAELDVTINPVEGLRLRPAVTYISSKIQGNFVNFDSYGQQAEFTGESFPYTPEWQANVDAEYGFLLSSDFDGYVGANWTYVGATNGGFGEYPIFDIDSYNLVDVRAGVNTPDGRWRVQLWARNLFDEYYYTAAYRSNDSINRFAGAPRTIGATLSFNY